MTTSAPDPVVLPDCAPPPRVHAWLTPPAAGWRPKSRGLRDSGLRLPLVTLATLIALLAATLLASLMWPHTTAAWLPVQLALILTAGAALAVVHARIHERLLEPLTYLRHWASRMRGGNLAARIPLPQRGEFGLLAADINNLSASLCALSRDLESRVRQATERLAQKTRSLEILYDVAATVHASSDLNDLLTRFLQTLKDVVDARAGMVRLLTDDGQLRLVASEGMDADVVERERLVPASRCLCGRVALEGTIQCRSDLSDCHKTLGRPVIPREQGVEMIVVPMTYRGRTLGVYNLFVEQPAPFRREDLNDLLTSIGRHLGMAIEKARLDEEAKRLALMEERTLLAHELHDSLAQTLAGLRFQVRMLRDTVGACAPADAEREVEREVERLANGLDEAYMELRALLAQFHAPMDERGLVPAIEQAVAKFKRDTGVRTLFQEEWDQARLSPHREIQVLRIVQEALSNIRKHAHAQTVRVILHQDRSDGCSWVLVEDDGVGLAPPETHAPGEHLGLSIMEDRARRIGGQLKIESEPGEGTRVLLTLPDSEARAVARGG